MHNATILSLSSYLCLATQQRLAKDSSLCPSGPQDLITLASFSAAAWQNYLAVSERATQLDVNLPQEMEAFDGLAVELELRLRPHGWDERLTKSYVVIGIWQDFLHALSQAPASALLTARENGWDVGILDWARPRIATWASDPTVHSRLSLWGRRVAGDTVAALRMATLPYPELFGNAAQAERIAQTLRERHAERMERAGLTA